MRSGTKECTYNIRGLDKQAKNGESIRQKNDLLFILKSTSCVIKELLDTLSILAKHEFTVHKILKKTNL